MTKKKIAILGGGVAALSCAYELSKTADLRAAYEVTVYQMGWRLGGKLASGRDALGRNLEHGLHVWFGCYENVFRLVRELYAGRTPPPNCPLKTWRDVAKPQRYTPLGVKLEDGWTYFPMIWLDRKGIPGDGKLNRSQMADVEVVLEMILLALQALAKDIAARGGALAIENATSSASEQGDLFERLMFALTTLDSLSEQEMARAEELFRGAETAAFNFADFAEMSTLWAKSVLRNSAGTYDIADLYQLHEVTRDRLRRQIEQVPPKGSNGKTNPMWVPLNIAMELLDIGFAAFRGYHEDLLKPDKPFEWIDDLDFRSWLVKHRGNPEIVANSTVTRVVYDTLFQYQDGDVHKPSYAAGTALGVISRLVGTYKGAMMWDIQVGMGEGLIAPLYEQLLRNDVKFQFFRRVDEITLSGDGNNIEQIKLGVQAKTNGGAPYKPTYVQENLTCWPSEPFWDQLDDGEEMKKAKVNFESHWCSRPDAAEPRYLCAGKDFDTVVLAIALGAFKPLNNERGMCDALIKRGGPFADWVSNVGIVPSQSLQIWSNQLLKQLGWTSGKPAFVSGPEYLDIWADMSQILAFESWPGYAKPCSLHYLTGTFATTLYKNPSTETGTPDKALAILRRKTLDWLDGSSALYFPKAVVNGKFNYDVLSDVDNNVGVARFDAQFLRANIDPTECCTASAAGTTKYRLPPDGSGFANLVLAGEGTRHGFNTTTVEGATMSGMAAARTICGSPSNIVGYDYLRTKPSESAEVQVRASASAFISWVGHGGASLASPAAFSGVDAYAFGIAASRVAMQNLVDKLLNRAGANKVHYESSDLARFAVLSFLNMQRCTSTVDIMGWCPGRECAIWLPLIETNLVARTRRVVFWSPYIFIDYDIGMLTGRETWGWPKVGACIAMPDGTPSKTGNFSCTTMLFPTLSADTQAKKDVLYSVSAQHGLPTPGPVKGQNLLELIFGDLVELVVAQLQREVPLLPVCLKQFRDSMNQLSACYQAIVESPLRLKRLGGMGLIDATGITASFTNCASHPIATDILGIAASAQPTVVPVSWALWAELDFEAIPGSVIASSI